MSGEKRYLKVAFRFVVGVMLGIVTYYALRLGGMEKWLAEFISVGCIFIIAASGLMDD
jgi:hypothetical protein